MPAGKPWIIRRPNLRVAPANLELWHVYSERFEPLSANPASQARMALPGTHSMFYAADTLAGALWETVLRYVEPDESRNVLISPGKLAGMRAAKVRLMQDDVPLLQLGQPGLRDLFPMGSDEATSVAALLTDPDHSRTHGEVRALLTDLNAFGITNMPMLSWPSRQLSTSTVYLAYAPPMEEEWWRVTGQVIALDDPDRGYAAIQEALKQHGYHWIPLATNATPPGPP